MTIMNDFAHKECIEREAAREAMLPLTNGNPILWSNIKRAISAIPAADVVEQPRWISVTERLPESGVHVLLACKTLGGNKYVCDGFHTEKFSQPTEFYEDIDADYREETDEYYFPEGWWEVIKNWDDYSCVAIEDTVTHWMPLPEPPKEETDADN